MRIYWITNGKRRGPATVPDVLSMLQLGDLSPDTPAWHEGCEGWHALRDLPALAGYVPGEAEPSEQDLPQTAPLPPEAADLPPVPHAVTMEISVPSAGARCLARLVDVMLYAFVALSIAYVLDLPYGELPMPGSVVFWAPMALVETFALYFWKTTPGKRWLGIRLQSVRGRYSFAMAFVRSLLVFTIGMGCMCGAFALMMPIVSYILLNRFGYSAWDYQSALFPVAKKTPTAGKKLAVISFLAAMFCLCSYLLLPWLPTMQDDLREENPRAASVIKALLPPSR